MEFREIIILNDEDGNQAEFELLDQIPYENRQYAVLSARGEDEGALVILLAEPDAHSGQMLYDEVENDRALMAVFRQFQQRHKDEFEFSE